MNYFKTVGTSIPIEFLCMWDVNTTPPPLEFTYPGLRSDVMAAWKAGLGPSGSIMTIAT